jgi:hypothetical protein
MFGPGVSTMPNEIKAKPSKAERWGMADSRQECVFISVHAATMPFRC